MKIKSWRAPDGTDPVDDHLWPAVKEFAPALGLKEIPYKSRDMKIGICVIGLKPWNAMSKKLVAVDPRGGHFFQPHIESIV